jgi:hypothetical protein
MQGANIASGAKALFARALNNNVLDRFISRTILSVSAFSAAGRLRVMTPLLPTMLKSTSSDIISAIRGR